MKLLLPTLAFAACSGLSVAIEDEACRLWLAPSHLSEQESPRFGLYAGVAFTRNETIPNIDIAIPFVDFLEGPHGYTYPDVVKALEINFWSADYAGAKWEGNHSSTVLAPGLGVLAQYHTAYSNVDWLQGAALLRQPPDFWRDVPQGQQHPSRGAISPYFNMTMRATTDIPAGMELFSSFGEAFDPQSVPTDLYEQQTTRGDYITADAILGRMQAYLDKYPDKLAGNSALALDIVEFMRETILGPHHGRRAKTIRSLLPATPKKVREATAIGGTFLHRNRDMIKSLKWIEQTGVCVDTLEVKPSTKYDAGFGAFATRDFKAGDRITVSPMIALEKDLLNMYKIYEIRDENNEKIGLEYDMTAPIGQQLGVNYAFGHRESSMIFLPTSPYMAYINHDSQDFNAYVDWSDHEYLVSREEITTGTLDELKRANQLSVIFQVIAVGDIKKGDEILINYGTGWETEWNAYMERLKQRDAVTEHALDVVGDYENQAYPVDLKVGKIPYPKGVVTACYIKVDEIDDGRPKKNEKDEPIMKWIGPSSFDEIAGVDLVVCDLISREMDQGGSYIYTVKARLQGANEIAQIEGVPHYAITLSDRPYKSDIHSPAAFRHWIEIDDQRFPQQWRDHRV